MQKVLRTEIKKAIMTRYFIISIAIGILISMLGLVYNVGLFCGNQRYDGMNPCYEAFTLFNHWIGGEGFSLGSSLYFFVFPQRYLTAKYIATFISGGLTMVVPLITNFMLTALFVPAIKPVPTYDTTYGVFGNSIFSELYYTHPLVYVLLYLFVDFMFCGALTCLTMLSASFIKYKWINCILPFVVCMGIALLGNIICSNEPEAVNYQLSPFYFTKCVQTSYPTKLSVIVGMLLLMVIVTVVFNTVFMRKKDIM